MKQPAHVLDHAFPEGTPDLAAGQDDLPAGIVRVTEQALASERYLRKTSEDCSSENPVRLAVFDFDGTSITGNSPVMLVRFLRRYMRKSVVARIVAWATAYKLRLPQNEAWVRGLVFSVFQGLPVSAVNRFLWKFYFDKVAPRFRPAADEAMQAHIDEGCIVVCVSATFEPIIAAAMTEHPIMFAIATRMAENPDEAYTDKVLGEPTEGPEKLAALTRFADDFFGKGAWILSAAYGDHHSDRTLLAAAERAYAVTPDQPLTRTAKEKGYPILNW